MTYEVSESGFSLRQMVATLGRYRTWLIVFIVSAVVSSLLLTFIYSERYRANTTLIYRPTENIRLQSRELQSFGFPVPLLPFEVIGQTISQLGTSELVLREVVERLELDQPKPKNKSGLLGLYESTKDALKTAGHRTWQVLKYGRTIEENPTSVAIMELAHNISIETKKKDYTAVIEVVDKNPQRAALIVDTIGEVLVRVLSEESVRAASKRREELDNLLVNKKLEIDGVRKQIEDLKTRHSFVSLRDEVSLNLRSTDHLESLLRENEKESASTRAKLVALQGQRAMLEPMIQSSQTMSDDELYLKLRDMKYDREIERAGLLQRLPADHIDITTLDAELAGIVTSLDAIERKRIVSETTTLNEIYQKVRAEELDTQASLEGLDAEHATLQEKRTQLRERFRDPAIESRYADLSLQLDVLESNYKQLATAWEETRIAELKSASEVRVLHRATPPDTPFRPIRIYHILLSGVLAVILGIGVAFLADFIEQYWRPRQVAGAMGR